MCFPILGRSLNECLLASQQGRFIFFFFFFFFLYLWFLFNISNLPTISRRDDEILPAWMLAYQHVRISRIRAPAHSAVKQLLVCEAR